ncbi:MAG TPA: globin domain-containing protein [Gemmatimonadales bacterium]|jgi:nitric oxide dioxygenase
MTPEAIGLVRESWAQVEDTRVDLAHAFYRHLFEIAPHVQSLFSQVTVSVQEEKFADMLGEIILVLDRPYQLLPQISLLGRRHMQYGVTAADYAPVGDALLLALKDRLGKRFTPRDSESLPLRGLGLAGVERHEHGRVRQLLATQAVTIAPVARNSESRIMVASVQHRLESGQGGLVRVEPAKLNGDSPLT